jgi:hypothetical protein
MGAPVFLVVTMKNTSEHVLHFNLTNPAFNYRATVLDATGKPVPETENFRRMKEKLKSEPYTSRNILVALNPQETCQDSIDLGYLYELAQPGTYSVQIERDMPPELGTGVVNSNIVKISVE